MATYSQVINQLTEGGQQLTTLAEQTRETYDYVRDCAEATAHRAEQMAALGVDAATVAAHRDAAAAMQAAHKTAEQMTACLATISALLTAAADAHRADYGHVADTARALPAGMAKPQFYARR